MSISSIVAAAPEFRALLSAVQSGDAHAAVQVAKTLAAVIPNGFELAIAYWPPHQADYITAFTRAYDMEWAATNVGSAATFVEVVRPDGGRVRVDAKRARFDMPLCGTGWQTTVVDLPA